MSEASSLELIILTLWLRGKTRLAKWYAPYTVSLAMIEPLRFPASNTKTRMKRKSR